MLEGEESRRKVVTAVPMPARYSQRNSLRSSWIAKMNSMHLGTDVQQTLGPVCAGPKPVSGRRHERLLRCAAAAHRSRELATGLNFSGLPGRGSRSSRWVQHCSFAWVSP